MILGPAPFVLLRVLLALYSEAYAKADEKQSATASWLLLMIPNILAAT